VRRRWVSVWLGWVSSVSDRRSDAAWPSQCSLFSGDIGQVGRSDGQYCRNVKVRWCRHIDSTRTAEAERSSDIPTGVPTGRAQFPFNLSVSIQHSYLQSVLGPSGWWRHLIIDSFPSYCTVRSSENETFNIVDKPAFAPLYGDADGTWFHDFSE